MGRVIFLFFCKQVNQIEPVVAFIHNIIIIIFFFNMYFVYILYTFSSGGEKAACIKCELIGGGSQRYLTIFFYL